MKSYPSIDATPKTDISIYAFDKIDGSNIRAEWNKKNGFWKFGTRSRLLDASEKPFGEAISLLKGKYEDDLSRIFVEEKWKKVIAFFEFYGPNSCFGTHADEPHDVTLIDVNPYNKGILPPREYIDLFGSLDGPAVLYQGIVNQDFIDSVKNSALDGMTFEGVVCKGVKSNQTVMFKVKSQAWLSKLRSYCKDNEQMFNKMK